MSEKTDTERARVGGRVIGVWLAIAAVIIVLIWQAIQIRVLQGEQNEAVARAKQEGALSAASAFAAAVEPLLYMRNQQSAVTQETFQNICKSLAESGRFELVAIADPSGVVIASSHLEHLGRPYPQSVQKQEVTTSLEGATEVIWPVVRNEVHFGSVVIQTK